jgi:hypothetical protein
MRCPFLREAQVKFCQVAPSRKMILRIPVQGVHEKCSSADYVTCSAAKEYHEEIPNQDRCPFLQESLMQYCAAAPVIKLLPYSESILSRCGNHDHLCCEVYLSMADPEHHVPAGGPSNPSLR